MSVVIETIQQVATSATPILVAYLGFKGKFRFDVISRKLSELEATNKREHQEIAENQEFINARDTLTKLLTKSCNSSIKYTEGAHDINTFKATFTSAVISLSESTLNSGFKFLNKDIFHGYMDIAGKKIIASYEGLPDDFVDFMRVHIKEASQSYYDGICELILDEVFNDKYDRFVTATESFLRAELMLITKHYWSYSKTESTYKIIE